MKDIVVGIDRSETARRAAEAAAELAAALNTNLHIVTCIERGKSESVDVGGDHFHIDPLSDAEDFLKTMALRLGHDSISRAVSFDSPADMLCDEAKRLEAQTIVVGNRRVQGVSRVLGSIATDVARHAPCNVYIVNTTG